MGLWESIDNISSYYNSLEGYIQPEQPAPRKLVQRIGPVIILKQDEDEDAMVWDDEDEQEPDEVSFGSEIEKLPFDEWDEEDREQ